MATDFTLFDNIIGFENGVIHGGTYTNISRIVRGAFWYITFALIQFAIGVLIGLWWFEVI